MIHLGHRRIAMHMLQNFCGFGAVRKLVEKILAADHVHYLSSQELTTFDGQNFEGLLIVRQIYQSFVLYDICDFLHLWLDGADYNKFLCVSFYYC